MTLFLTLVKYMCYTKLNLTPFIVKGKNCIHHHITYTTYSSCTITITTKTTTKTKTTTTTTTTTKTTTIKKKNTHTQRRF